MSQQRPYEGFSYPTEFQSGAGVQGDTYFSASRATPPSSTAPAGATGGVASTGLTRRSAQHTGNTSAHLVAAGGNGNASVNGAGPVSVPVSAASPVNNGGQYPGSYGYFHGRGNSIDVNSGYNSDAGSSVSNPRYFAGTTGGYAMQLPSSRVPDVAASANDAMNTTGVSPIRPPQAPRFGGARHGPAVPGISAGEVPSSLNNSVGGGPAGGGGGGAFHTGDSDGRAGSVANSPRSSDSVRPPVAPPAFLPSRPFVQTPPLPASSPLGGVHAHTHHHQHQQQQPYMVPMPSSMHTFQSTVRRSGSDPLGGAGPQDSTAAQRPLHAVSPSTAGPRMPALSGGYGTSSTGAGGSHTGNGVGGGGFFSRMMAQVIPTFDDGNAAAAAALGGDGGSVQREVPAHQLRFGNPEDDLPLLEELGIFPRHILDKARAVLNPFKAMSVDAAKDTDLAGPILFALSLAIILSLRGKFQFSAIYGLFVIGVAFFKVLLSLMQPKSGGAPLQFVVSTVGYGLLPTVLLALIRIVWLWLLTRRSLLPVTLLTVVWSAWCGSALVAKGLGMQEQKYLVLYPMLLFYAAFDALTVY